MYMTGQNGSPFFTKNVHIVPFPFGDRLILEQLDGTLQRTAISIRFFMPDCKMETLAILVGFNGCAPSIVLFCYRSLSFEHSSQALHGEVTVPHSLSLLFIPIKRLGSLISVFKMVGDTASQKLLYAFQLWKRCSFHGLLRSEWCTRLHAFCFGGPLPVTGMVMETPRTPAVDPMRLYFVTSKFGITAFQHLS